MLEELRSAAKHIFEITSKTREEALKIRNSNILIKEALEKEIFKKVEKKEITGLVCAVDGGLLAQEMHGVDLIIGRGASVIFEYGNSKLKRTDYYPNAFPKPEYSVQLGLDEQEINAFRNLFRLQIELDCAINTLKKFDPKILMMDGSLVPLTQDRPQEGSIIFDEYKKTISKYKELYSICEEKNCLLLGIIKDSRGRRFMDCIRGLTSIKSADTVFLNNLLNEKERSFVLKITKDPKKHMIMRDLDEWAEKIKLFYLKSVKNDRPMRVEFLSSTHTFDEVASVVYSLSAINESYAYPAILIEADLRAMLDLKEMERMQKTLQMFSSKEILPLRRNNRPFR